MYRNGPLDAYVSDAAANKPAPGGGSVSALAGALAAAMSEMAANFTVGKKKFADVEDEVRRLLADLASLRETLLDLVDRDVAAYSAVDAAYSMPKGTNEQEKAARSEAMAQALRGAMQAPLEVMRRCARVAEVADRLADVANPNLITDVGVSAILAEAACAAARLNVEINLKFLKDEELARRTTREMDALSGRVEGGRRSVAQKVAVHLTG